MTTNRRLETLRGLLHNPVSESNTLAIAALFDAWPEDDQTGRSVADELARETVAGWATELERNAALIKRSFPQWTGALEVKVSIRLCGGDTERRTPIDGDDYVSGTYFGAPVRFEAVCVEERRARSPDEGEEPDGVVWLIEPS